MSTPADNYFLTLSPQAVQVLFLGLGELPGKVMFDVAVELRKQVEEQNAVARARPAASG